MVKRLPLLKIRIAQSLLSVVLANSPLKQNDSLDFILIIRSSFFNRWRGGLTKPLYETTFYKSVEGVDWSHYSVRNSSICLIHECAFEFAWLVVQMPLILAGTRLKNLTLGGDLLSPRGSYSLCGYKSHL